MASQPNNKNPEENHDAKIIAVIIVFAILSVIATVLRVVSRRMKKTKLAVEDYMVFVALVRTSRNHKGCLCNIAD